MDQQDRINYMINYLEKERGNETIDLTRPQDQAKEYLRALINIRPPQEISEEFLAIEDSFLTEENQSRDRITLADLTPIRANQYLWQGDITQLQLDAIVNAANSQLLGCFVPNHSCIDNIIHTRAGVKMRLYMNDLMVKQSHDEGVGLAKISPGYQLPAKYVIHTVGPAIPPGQAPGTQAQEALRSSYISSLKLAQDHGLTNIAFPCISTGVFNFPQELAALIAVAAVTDFQGVQRTLGQTPIQVVFNVFTDRDFMIYRDILSS